MVEQVLQGRRVLITGGARRLGRIFALACAHHGADVVIHHGHSPAEAQELRELIHAEGKNATIVAADLEAAEDVSRLAAEFGTGVGVDALVNSAAIFEPLALADTDRGAWERHLAINLTAPFLLAQAFARSHRDGSEGAIVNVLDWRALRPGVDHFPYTVSKAALAAMTKSLALALAPQIRVNGLALGAVLPPSDARPTPDILERIPLRRWAEPGDVTSALIYLLSPGSYVTGEILLVDGGRHLT